MNNIWLKKLLVVAHDMAWVPMSLYLAFWFRFSLEPVTSSNLSVLIQFIAIALPVHAASFWFFGCYRGIWRFASIPDLLRILRAIITGAVISGALIFFYSRFAGVPRSILILYPLLLFIGVGGARVFYRIVRTHHLALDRSDRDKVLVVGAGQAGDMLLRDLLNQGQFLPVGIVDDSPLRRGTELHGVRVIGNIANLPELLESMSIDTVLIAIPSAPRSVMDKIIRACTEKGIPCRTLPSLLELANGRVEVSRLRPVTVGDLLGRETVTLNESAIDGYLAGKVVAITGSGGSIGSELCRQVLAHRPAKLILIENGEYNLYQIEHELRFSDPSSNIVPVLADIRFKPVIDRVFSRYKPQVVFHAAAYKHVPMVESNIIEGVRNNIIGTRNIADISVQYGVSKFVQVSTDKTVNPTNIMGASKRIAEIYCQALDKRVKTDFVTTRFGNVLGSAGSVIPLFEKQIKVGGPVTVTHPEITRFFMTIPEAASLILQAGAMGAGGEIFVLDMGKPVKIRDLAENLIRLSGLQPGVDIQIKYIGLRPGEKMHEELFYSQEKLTGTGHAKLMLANCQSLDWESLQQKLILLDEAVGQFNEEVAVKTINELIPEFSHIKPVQNRNDDTHSVRLIK